MMFLKQSTVVTLNFGPFVDPTDGVTPKITYAGTGAGQLDNGTTGLRISKNGASLGARNGAPTNLTTYDAFGIYKVWLDATDTGTLGRLHCIFAVSTALPIWRDFLVVTPNYYDSLTNITTFQKVDIAAVNTVAGDAPLLSAHIESALTGTVNTAITAADSTHFSCSDVSEATASNYVGKECWIITGTLTKQRWGVVTGYALTGGEGRFTLSPGSPTTEVPITGNIALFV